MKWIEYNLKRISSLEEAHVIAYGINIIEVTFIVIKNSVMPKIKGTDKENRYITNLNSFRINRIA